MNKLIGEKIAIMSDRPQTTRNRIMCILNTEQAQLIFMDTPGIHKPQHKLGEYMVHTALTAIKDVDVLLFVVDATEKIGPGEQFILEQLTQVQTPVVLVLNKIDKLSSKGAVLQAIEAYKEQYRFQAILPVSALEETDFTPLVTELTKHLPVSPCLYPEDMLTDQTERVIAAEMIREKILLVTRDEVPHSIAVEIDDFKLRANENLYIKATIYVERDSQKGIVIGAGGKLLKNIGQAARKDIEKMTGNKVYLELWVKVRADWRNKDKSLRQFGYRDEE